mmetsp:Transcript_22822/g.58092  ORF Transcript_22822/g.58092 Transcript_22822/m.58092 type:complete len:319 (+) Transcript_22822:1073-2029(+)
MRVVGAACRAAWYTSQHWRWAASSKVAPLVLGSAATSTPSRPAAGSSWLLSAGSSCSPPCSQCLRAHRSQADSSAAKSAARLSYTASRSSAMPGKSNCASTARKRRRSATLAGSAWAAPLITTRATAPVSTARTAASAASGSAPPSAASAAPRLRLPGVLCACSSWAMSSGVCGLGRPSTSRRARRRATYSSSMRRYSPHRPSSVRQWRRPCCMSARAAATWPLCSNSQAAASIQSAATWLCRCSALVTTLENCLLLLLCLQYLSQSTQRDRSALNLRVARSKMKWMRRMMPTSAGPFLPLMPRAFFRCRRSSSSLLS